MITRSTLAALAGVLAVSCAAPAQNVPVIDVHTHTDFEGDATLERYTTELAEAGVVGAVAHVGRDGSGYVDLRAANVLHCAGVGAEVDAKLLEDDLRSGKVGCVKIYLGYVYRFASDPAYEPVYSLAKTYDVPVVFHTGDTYDVKGKLKYADPLTIDEVAVDHPDVRFVIAHCGNPWIQSAAEVAYKNPNVFLECSALLIGELGEDQGEAIERYVVAPIAWIFGYLEDPSKLMFGTDWPLSRVRPYLEAYKRAIPREHWGAVFHDNALRVFKGLATTSLRTRSASPARARSER